MLDCCCVMRRVFSHGEYYIDIEEACYRSGRTRRTIRYHVERKNVKTRKIPSRGRGGKKLMISEADLKQIYHDYRSPSP
jgi:hypothetical protein